MDKRLIHFKIPSVIENGNIKLLVKVEMLNSFYNMIANRLKYKYDVIFSPFDLNYFDSEEIKNINIDEKTLEEFLKENNLYKKENKPN